uniref:GST N-terminal domain-containing protein n=1 Tax=Monopterus albus TaxID=43700 RepID=A0A3Q3R156_MONAL
MACLPQILWQEKNKMEHKSQEVLDINPRVRLPSFKHADIIGNESYAVCFYLEVSFKSQGNKLIPDSPAEQVLMYQCIFEGLTFYEKLTKTKKLNPFISNVKPSVCERHDSALKKNREALVTELKLWKGYLQEGNVINACTSKLSRSPILTVLNPPMSSVLFCRLSAENFPKLAEYYAQLKERPSIKASWPPRWLEHPKGQVTLKDI